MLKLEEKIKELPPEAQRELEDFWEILISKHSERRNRRLKQNWAGGLRDLRDKYTSLELQKNLSNGGETTRINHK